MSDEKKVWGSQSGTTDLFAVEARSTHRPATIGGTILTKEWTAIHFQSAKLGVPNCALHPISDKHLGLYTFEAATALMHWFLTLPEEKELAFVNMHPLCVEARLVRVKLTYSYSTEETGVGETVSHFEMRRAAKFTERREAVGVRGK